MMEKDKKKDEGCRKGNKERLLSNGPTILLLVFIIVIRIIASSSSIKNSVAKSVLLPSSVTVMRSPDVQTLNVGSAWQIVRIHSQSDCRLDPEAGDTVQVRFGLSDQVFEKANDRWFSNGQPLDQLPDGIAVNQFEIRSKSGAISVRISTWPK